MMQRGMENEYTCHKKWTFVNSMFGSVAYKYLAHFLLIMKKMDSIPI